MKYMVLALSLFIIAMVYDSELYAEGVDMPSHKIASVELPIDIVGISVVPHTYSKEIRYSRPVSDELGSLVRLFVIHRDPTGDPLELQLNFNDKKPSELVADDEWSWYEMPENLSEDGKPYLINPGMMDVFTFNAKTWGIGSKFSLGIEDEKSGNKETVDILITQSDVRINLISCLADEDDSIYPERLLIHFENVSDKLYKIKQFRVFASTAKGVEELKTISKFSTFTGDRIIPPKDRSGAELYTGKLPLTHGVLEVVVEDESGKENSVWAYLRFKVDGFDIGSGWLEIPSRPGVVPVTKESYLKLLKRMHVNLAHMENIPGYTDSLGDGGLYTRYPMSLMSGFGDIDRYNTDEWVAKIHGVDAVGEPQLGLTPMETYEALKKYKRARYPTTLTLSEDSGFRYYAGLADFPHFDAYRVTAPSADTWWLYDRWENGKILWGAPLEGIGEMTRTLRAISRPLPIALWSQNVSGGWEGGLGRKRRSPTSYEILIQAYQGLANGVMGLYWYSLQTWSVLKYRDTLEITTRIGREIRLLHEFYVNGDAYKHERISVDNKPKLDLNSIVTPDSALLFIIDLDYEPDRKAQIFRAKGTRPAEAGFQLPGYLEGIKDAFRVDANGIYDVDWESTSDGVKIEDQLKDVNIYVATKDMETREILTKRLKELVAFEESIGFDPANNDDDFAVLMRDLGFESIEDVGPMPKPKRPISESNAMANPVYLALESAVQKEINLSEDQIDSIYRIAEKYQLELYDKMMETRRESHESSSEQSRDSWRRRRERLMEIAEELLPKYLHQLNSIFQPDQMKRLEQITLQAAGISALKDARVAEALELTKEQQDKISSMEDYYNQKKLELYRRDISRDERRAKTAEINRQQSDETMKALSDNQRKKFEELKGEIFEM
jgi:hypothetical protein